MKTKKHILLYLVLFPILIIPSAMAETTVVGTGDPALDVPAIQNAVNGGGIVTLLGTFDFGQGQVVITNSVEIVGENATIINGIVPFYVHSPGSDIEIGSLTLVNPMDVGIYSLSCGSLTIDKVNINGVRTYLDARWGIFVNGYGQYPRTMVDNISITNCDIDLVGTDEYGNPLCPYADDSSDNYTMARGIVVGWGIGTFENEVNILINSNTLRNTTQSTILVTDIAGVATIKNNICEPGNLAIINPVGGFSGNNITIGQHEPEGWGDPAIWAKYIVMKNTLECVPKNYPDGSPYNGFSWGILAFGTNRALIKKNKITSTATDIYLIAFDSSSEAYVGQNKLIGTSLWAGMVIIGYTADNIFVGNNLTGVDGPTYFFGENTVNNTVKGYTGGSDSVIDVGTDNFLTGVTPMVDSGGIGQQISQAMQELHEYLRQEELEEPVLP